MSTTLDKPPISIFEVDAFLRSLGDIHEPECESSHNDAGNFQCSHAVVARKTTCVKSFNICAVSEKWNQAIIQEGWNCSRCDRPARVCWSVRPI